MAGVLNITCVEDIINLPDVASLRKLKKQWNVEGKDLKNRDDYVRILVEFYKNNRGGVPSSSEPPPDTTAGLADAIALDKKNRMKMREKYDEVLQYYKDLPPQYQKNLDKAYSDIPNKIATKKKDLDSRDLTILVAGDTGAGKSSFINMLLETEILPTSQIEATQTICELRKSVGGKKEAICYFKSSGDKKRRAPEIIPIDNAKGIEELQKRIVYKDADDENPFDRIEICMPFPMLEEGVVIVDSPGFGEHGRKSSIVERYLAKSFGTIYLVNTASAGGLNAGRLRDFLRVVVNSAGDDYNPSATIFIGNKTDSVDKRDLNEVMQTTRHKLKQCYPGLRDENIFFMSITEATKAMNYGTRRPEHVNVLKHGIQKLFPASLKSKLNSHYRFQSQILKRSLVSLKVARTMAATGMDKKQDQIEEIQQRMRNLELNAKDTIRNLKQEIKKEEQDLYDALATSLRSRKFTEKVFNLRPDQCARPAKDWKSVAKDANDIIGNIIAMEVDLWESENKKVEGIKTKILDNFTQKCQMYEEQMKEIESTLLAGDVRAISDLHKSMKKQAPVKQLWTKAAKNPKGEPDKINSLGSVVSSAGGLSSNDRKVKDICKNYNQQNVLAKMQELVSVFIENIFDGQDLRIKIDRFVGRYGKGVDSIAKKIPDFIEADRELIKNISEEIQNAESNLRNVFPKFLSQGSRLQGQLDMFYVTKIMEMDYRLRDIQYSPAEDLLGSGSFAEVFTGKLICVNPPETVALKVAKDPLLENNVSDVLLEDRTMRELDHENIVHYYGAALREEVKSGKRRLYWIMVIEHCVSTLKHKIIDGDYDNPAKVGSIYAVQVEQMEDMAKMVVQMCEGLKFLHDKGLVHRDLKLENILIAKKNGKEVIKLTDVGLTKPESMIGASIVGSPAYMAPEVLLQTEIHNHKADIYSLAIILWEMWYGIDAAEHIQHQLFGTIEKAVKGGLRPSFSIEFKPPADWMNVIKSCWEYESSKRPETSEVLAFFQNFLNAH